MKTICTPKDINEAREIYQTILTYLRGSKLPEQKDGHIVITEKLRQYFTWGATSFVLIGSTCGCVGIQFVVSGLIHKGRVRIYYNPGTDYFDIELLKPRKDEVIKHFEDVDLFQLHNICHRNIERIDDIEV